MMINKRLFYSLGAVALFGVFTIACMLLPAATPALPGKAETLAAETWSAMQPAADATELSGIVYGEQGPGGPTATLPKAATATPRPSATIDPSAKTPEDPVGDLAGTAAAGLEVLLTSAPTLAPFLTEALADPVSVTEEAVDEPLHEAPEIGALAPSFSLVDAISGETVQLNDFRGKAVLINFWTTWCTYCKEEMREIQKSYDIHKDQGFVVLAIDVKEGRTKVREFGQALDLNYNLLLDSNGAVASSYLAYTFPTTYFIGRDGVIVNIIVGAMDSEEIDWYVQSILE